MGLDQMKKWSEEFEEKFGHPEKTVLIMDRLKSHTNKEIQSVLEKKDVKCFFLPPQGAKFASVCDNPFFAVLKSRLQKMDTSTTDKKEKHSLSSVRNSQLRKSKNFIPIVDGNSNK